MLIQIPNTVKELIAVAGALAIFYGVLYYQDTLFGVSKILIAIPIVIVGMYLFLRYYGVKLEFKKRKPYGERI